MHGCLQELRHGLEAHLRLHFNNSESSDDAVLSSYPTTLKRRVLRHLYLDQVKVCSRVRPALLQVMRCCTCWVAGL